MPNQTVGASSCAGPRTFTLGMQDENGMTSVAFIIYILEIRIGSMRNDPVCQLESSLPFGAMSVGDKFHYGGIHHEAWHDLPKEGEGYFI